MPTPWQFSMWRRRTASQVQSQQAQFQQVILTHKYVVALFAFLVSVDLIEIVGVLCYQLFTASYFPWHLYPMMLNRAVELVAFICSRGHIPSLYSVAQILLSLLSLAVYAKRQPCNKYSCAAPLVLYSILLSYQIFVAIMVVKVSRMPMADDDGHIIANWPTTQVSPAADVEDHHLRPLGIQIIGLSPRAMRARIINQVAPHETGSANSASSACNKAVLCDPGEVIYAVQQPDGQKLAIARVCRDAPLKTNPVGFSSSIPIVPSGHTLASHLRYEMRTPLQISIEHSPTESELLVPAAELETMAVTVGERQEVTTCSDHDIEDMDEIELHDPLPTSAKN